MAAKSQSCHRYQNQGKLEIRSDTAKLELKDILSTKAS